MKFFNNKFRILILAYLFIVSSQYASIITVNNTGDGGSGSLRKAISDAVSGDEIQFSVTGTITLTAGELAVNKNLTITGPGAGLLAISGNNTSRIFNISSSTTVSISSLTITNGQSAGAPGIGSMPGDPGGAIINNGNLTITDCLIENSKCGSGCAGTESEIIPGMWTTGGAGGDGGGIANVGVGAALTVIGSTICNNQGGDAGPGTYGGQAGKGGGIFNDPNSTLILTNCTIAYNTAMDGQSGGGLYIQVGAVPPIITNCTIARNTGGTGGGVNFSSYTSADAYIKNSLIAYNTGSSGSEDVSLWLVNIIGSYNAVRLYDAAHDFSSDANTIAGISASYNLDATLRVNCASNEIPTLRLLTGSAAINAGSSAANNGIAIPSTDQRGFSRSGNVDIGAYEYDPSCVIPPRTITNTDDDGSGSLRNAISIADPGDIINFSVTGTITLTSGELVLGKDLTITGPGAGSLAISGGNNSRIFNVSTGTTVSVSGLTITNGKSADGSGATPGGSGGAILNSGDLTITNCIIQNSKCGKGGAGSVVMLPPFFTPTPAPGGPGGSGGGISNNASGLLTIVGSTVNDNQGGSAGPGGIPVGGPPGGPGGNAGGINNAGTLTLTNCQVSSNIVASGNGGGIDNSGSLTMTGCTVSSNIDSSGSGGGVNNTGTLTSTGCTISSNKALNGVGGGISSSGVAALVLTNCTIAFNIANGSGFGSGVNASGNYATITNCTISQNTGSNGGGLTASWCSNLYLKNTLIANNIGTAGMEDFVNQFSTITASYNAIGKYDVSYRDFSLDAGTTTGTSVSDYLGTSLNTNGAASGIKTLALLAGSSAINAGSSDPNNGITIPTADQRGVSRVGAVDIGAYEFDGSLPVEVTSFDAKELNNKIIIQWKTATEVDCYGFDVERRLLPSPLPKEGGVTPLPLGKGQRDGLWETLGFVAGAGNSNSPKEYSFIDSISHAGNLQYRLKQMDLNGNSRYYEQIIEVNFLPTGVNEKHLPKEFALSQNYPNPFNPSTDIEFAIADFGFVSLKVYDVLGKEVATLVNGNQLPGYYCVNFNASNLSTGVYIYRLTAGKFISTKKLILIK